MPLQAIRALVQDELSATDQFIRQELHSEIPLINDLIQHIIKGGGKRIRPLLLLLSARAFDQHTPAATHLAAAIEMIHTATLLHDDVIDHAILRRGHETANALFGNQASILVGDFLYSRAFQWIVNLNHHTVLTIFSKATHFIAEGEIMQLINCHDADTSEQKYFEVIRRKTAKLFEVAAQAGTALSAETSHIDSMQQYGAHVGTAYQLIDDVLDYQASSEETGKAIGNDLKEGKPTLPLIYALRKTNTAGAKLIREAISTGSTENLADILTLIETTGALKYTTERAQFHAAEAKKALTSLPLSPYRTALQNLTTFIVERAY